MQNETRVNLKHLLEDMRDSYSSPLEEVILTELIANALDSRATRIEFTVNSAEYFMRCVDNGVGMKRTALRDYHNIAASKKVRGEGIGFAGVGAKLSLLLADKVVTESKGGRGSRAATEWRLTNQYRAPWKFVPAVGAVPYPRGTSVSMYFTDAESHLMREDFVRDTIIKHYYPLLNEFLTKEILKFVYKKGIEFFINGKLLELPHTEQRVDNGFHIYLGKGHRPIGAGFLTKKVLEQGFLARLAGRSPNEHAIASGLSVSTYGKVIKTGWEWLGIMPKSAEALCGVVEIPMLSELLTTNKSDFLTDASHLKKFYRLRKAVQQGVLPVLRSLGEYADKERDTAKSIRPLERQIETALETMSTEFPELESLFGARRGKAGEGGLKNSRGESLSVSDNEPKISKKDPNEPQTSDSFDKKQKSQNSPAKSKKGLILALEELSDMPEALGRMIDDTVSINTLHPVWKKSLATKQEEYHILVVVGLVLADFVAPDKHPQEFLAKLLSSWSKTGDETSGQSHLL
ncbi:MAG: hypothetical protein A3G52_02015 [Candidatus Taylorbacteria bacterium RIFCSPLOWO2_12_FULL_43_20]|uniref:Histidine kinase/HSP90-like ATPase domain-containing protein n=1 Tax=Candidatus Taylorbacteria bacterium RIFCSPLOWO2_12_FULL_43_20 TaxID=1802332 RepID=A0A1G2P3R9_9BACT|nr:MAG: hypothetical protein A3B98_01985 [Candidatus Taylorbacteria bacterium RIFCSPHIGHO2_02_FULL_43_55]OHA30143.1 MAG: hypothetical protein A3E92_01020 [Candidatus Taylorbacteria bacterium RIFCSPHIGHO2_12_FULL_42_34]OHA31795.1 MAG: hypothetical protein A3B09_02525 [Candidatus Taylorbacteria bacterium RIFCSPLOWO2_01_FULL_43_83]OHA39614.1 MAG: hypothetical protein A3H58_02460 [Candidatus Taylorbacteria bacterium RIFCSPLOWO2_02_FULL_43_22b]OHA42995.1 MAG: hypothetical protein A3G52_02015 [Candid